ncbi:sulfurtransferase [Aquimarina sp. 2201CG14-23]|uniref:sulfurtransferase n=1 Tax=Aquimarina mycalae TaxID=3040073 RepID=UPI002477E66B|nr:sulfurtransferase [Aquimarina sp. 2201CG14-23]MDH7445141.1 sulfurtransferase [Aquimarina sp. 2201CG14-23]
MIYKNSISLLLIALLFSCNNNNNSNVETKDVPVEVKSYVSTKHIIEAEELFKISKKNSVKIIDFRRPKKYTEKHIEGALNIWRTDIEDTSYPYGGMMAKKDEIETLFSALGIRNSDQVVVYDDRGGCDAARLWWVLKNYGFESVQLLNGGLAAWKQIGGVINNKKISSVPSVFVLPEKSEFELYIDKDRIKENIDSKEKMMILDTRSIDEFSGKRQKKGAHKGGRIPESKRIDWIEAIHYNGDMKFKSYQELEKVYEKMKVSKDDLIVTYCHSGVRSAHTTFILTELLGYSNVKNYDGSWTEWSFFDNLPFQQDSITKVKL